MSASQHQRFLSPKEVADLAGVSTRAIYRAIQRGELHAVRLGSRLRVSQEALDEWVDSATVRHEPRVVEVRVVHQSPVRGSFRRLLADQQNGGSR